MAITTDLIYQAAKLGSGGRMMRYSRRLLIEEGLNWRIEEDDQAHSGHHIVLFADSTQTCATQKMKVATRPDLFA